MWTRREWLIAMAVLAGRSAFAAEDGFLVVIHPDNAATSVGRDFLRDAYLKKVTDWSAGTTIRPIDLSSKFAAREVFVHEIVRKSPAQLRSYWSQQIFSGKGTPPIEAASPAELIEYVVANPGAVGYVPAGTSTGRAKVVKVR